MMSPAISVAIFQELVNRFPEHEMEIFETTYYSDDYNNRHIRLEEVGAIRKGKDNFNDDAQVIRVKPTNEILPDYIKKIEAYKPDVIFFSTAEDTWPQTKSFLEAARPYQIKTLIGGVFPTAAPEIVLGHPDVNYICVHEGEGVVQNILEGKDWEDILGIHYKDKNGKIHQNGVQPLWDINSVIPDFRIYEKDGRRWKRPMGGRMFQKVLPMETYRGCPYSCTYCNSPFTREYTRKTNNGSFLRRKTPKVIDEEFQVMRERHNPDMVMFIDDSFLARPKDEIFEFSKLWGKHKTPFWFNTRIENCDPDVLQAMKEAGAYRMAFGLEAGSEEYRKKYLNRRVSNEKYRKYFKYINDSNICYNFNVIIGMPFETRELVLETARLVKDALGYDSLTISYFTPYRGTALRDIAVEAGMLTDKYVYGEGYIAKEMRENHFLQQPIGCLTPEDTQRLMKCFSLYAYYPESRWDEVYEAETNDEIYKELMDYYHKNFLSEYQLGGKDRINKRFCAQHDATTTYSWEIVA